MTRALRFQALLVAFALGCASAPKTDGDGDVPAAGGAASERAGSAALAGAGAGGGLSAAGAGGSAQAGAAGSTAGLGGAPAPAGSGGRANTASGAGGGAGMSSPGAGTSSTRGAGGRGGALASAGAGGHSPVTAGAGGHSAGTGTSGAPPTGPLTVYLAGDSTVQNYTDTPSPNDQAGWGQMLGALFSAKVTVDNRALGGRTARRFIDEGHLDEIVADLAAGDYLLVQFGTNDSNKTATYDLNGTAIPYYLDPETDFKTYLEQYVAKTRAKHAFPVFVTPPPRNSAYCTGGNGTGDWAQAMRELGSADDVPVLDLNRRAVDYLKAICPSPTPEDFFLVKSDMTVDGTHFQENGARILAGFVADEMRNVNLPLAALLR